MHHPRTPRHTRLLAAAAAASLLAGCGGDDAGADPDGAAPATEDDAAPAADGSEAGDPDAASDGGDAAASDGAEGAVEEAAAGAGTGQVEVDGVAATFTPEVCVFSPDDPTEFSINGPGTLEDGTPVFVDAVGPNQLVVYVGTDDAFGDAERIYEVNPMATGGDPMASLGGLEASEGAVQATPEFVVTDADRTAFDPVGDGSYAVTC